MKNYLSLLITLFNRNLVINSLGIIVFLIMLGTIIVVTVKGNVYGKLKVTQ